MLPEIELDLHVDRRTIFLIQRLQLFVPIKVSIKQCVFCSLPLEFGSKVRLTNFIPTQKSAKIFFHRPTEHIPSATMNDWFMSTNRLFIDFNAICRSYATDMTSVCLSVCPSVCNIGGL